MSALRELAARVSNWGRWGADDERGTVNFITPEVVRRGAACVRRGQVFSLGLPLGADGPQIGTGGRFNPIHLMSAIGAGIPHDPEGFRYNDDVVTMPLQCATQWDGLAHVYYGEKLYNAFPASTVTAAGAARHAMHQLAIRDMGLTLGEMFVLDALADDCAADGVWEFLFAAPPLRVTGGVGSPLNPLAVK